jgi:hypothetical protein
MGEDRLPYLLRYLQSRQSTAHGAPDLVTDEVIQFDVPVVLASLPSYGLQRKPHLRI